MHSTQLSEELKLRLRTARNCAALWCVVAKNLYFGLMSPKDIVTEVLLGCNFADLSYAERGRGFLFATIPKQPYPCLFLIVLSWTLNDFK